MISPPYCLTNSNHRCNLEPIGATSPIRFDRLYLSWRTSANYDLIPGAFFVRNYPCRKTGGLLNGDRTYEETFGSAGVQFFRSVNLVCVIIAFFDRKAVISLNTELETIMNKIQGPEYQFEASTLPECFALIPKIHKSHPDSEGIELFNFPLLWNEINGYEEKAWNANPYVWVVEFKRVGGVQ